MFFACTFGAAGGAGGGVSKMQVGAAPPLLRAKALALVPRERQVWGDKKWGLGELCLY